MVESSGKGGTTSLYSLSKNMKKGVTVRKKGIVLRPKLDVMKLNRAREQRDLE